MKIRQLGKKLSPLDMMRWREIFESPSLVLPNLVKGVSALGMGIERKRFLGFFPTQNILWFYYLLQEKIFCSELMQTYRKIIFFLNLASTFCHHSCHWETHWIFGNSATSVSSAKSKHPSLWWGWGWHLWYSLFSKTLTPRHWESFLERKRTMENTETCWSKDNNYFIQQENEETFTPCP